MITYKFRVKDSTTKKLLNKMSRDVNMTWNVCNEQARKKWKESRSYLRKSDVNQITKGASKEFSINQQSVQAVSYELLTRLKQEKKQLRWRSKKSFGWIPFNGQTIKLCGDYVIYDKKVFRFWKSREVEGVIKTGSFNQDARGRWYINIAATGPAFEKSEQGELGIDLGLITTATDSNGEKISASNYRRLEKKLAMAQRAKKKKLAKTITAKIKNCRKDTIEKYTTKIAKENVFIVVGNVSSQKLVKTKMAKSVLDNGWGVLKTRLSHKAIRHGGKMIEVNEAYTSRTCSNCLIGWNLPKGLKSLAIREYVCPCCGVEQDRDVNAARNILRVGHDSLTRGIPVL
jgi:IS605 OrfB family transposase